MTIKQESTNACSLVIGITQELNVDDDDDDDEDDGDKGDDTRRA
jgi:hypothetical protein